MICLQHVLTEAEQGVNAEMSQDPMRAIEASVKKNLHLGQDKVIQYNQSTNELNLSDDDKELYIKNNPSPISTNVSLGLVSNEIYAHDIYLLKNPESRTHGDALAFLESSILMYPLDHS